MPSSLEFDDMGWSNGCAPLGYGDHDECTADRSLAAGLVEPPRLAISIAGTNAQISWPNWGVHERLEASERLGPDAVWQPVQAPLQSEAPERCILQPLAGPARFYRLRLD